MPFPWHTTHVARAQRRGSAASPSARGLCGGVALAAMDWGVDQALIKATGQSCPWESRFLFCFGHSLGHEARGTRHDQRGGTWNAGPKGVSDHQASPINAAFCPLPLKRGGGKGS